MVTIQTIDPKTVTKKEMKKAVGMVAKFDYECPNGLSYPQCVRIDRILDSCAIQGQCYKPSVRKWMTFSIQKITGLIHIELEE